MFQKPNIAILIPAAGDSRRMGSPKQLLKWRNTTLLEHTIETAQELNVSKLIVVLGANYERIKTKINKDQIEIIRNDNWKLGLGKSIAFGIDHILKNDSEFDGVLVMLADQPLIDATFLNSILDKFQVEQGQIIATSYKNGKQGVPVLFDKVYFDELSQLNDDKGAKIILHKHSENVSVIDGNNMVLDIDTLQDYNRLYKDNH